MMKRWDLTNAETTQTHINLNFCSYFLWPKNIEKFLTSLFTNEAEVSITSYMKLFAFIKFQERIPLLFVLAMWCTPCLHVTTLFIASVYCDDKNVRAQATSPTAGARNAFSTLYSTYVCFSTHILNGRKNQHTVSPRVRRTSFMTKLHLPSSPYIRLPYRLPVTH